MVPTDEPPDDAAADPLFDPSGVFDPSGLSAPEAPQLYPEAVRVRTFAALWPITIAQ